MMCCSCDNLQAKIMNIDVLLLTLVCDICEFRMWHLSARGTQSLKICTRFLENNNKNHVNLSEKKGFTDDEIVTIIKC